MKPILLFFPGSGPRGNVAETLGRLLPDVEVVGINYPEWRELTDPQRAMDHVLQYVDRQVRPRVKTRTVLILGYSLGAQIGWGFAHDFQRAGGTVAFFAAINGRIVSNDKPDGRWVRRAFRQLSSNLLKGDLRAVRAFISSRASRLLQRTAGGDLPKLAARWAKRDRLPWFLSRSPVFETELNMRLLIRAAGPWTQRIESELPPIDCPSLLVRGPEDESFDECWRTLCSKLDIKAVSSSHLAIMEPGQLQEVVELIKTATREHGVTAKTPTDAGSP